MSDTAKTLKFVSKNSKFIAKNVLSKNDLSEVVKNMAKDLGASEVGIVTKKTLEGGPVSTDLDYVLPGAKSALVFAVPLDQNLIEPYLSKKDHSLNKNKIRTTTFTRGIASEIAEFLDMIGFESKAISPNFVYRKDTPNGIRDMKPIISHRYLEQDPE
jgi:epoxyqueuosine reductase QueG